MVGSRAFISKDDEHWKPINKNAEGTGTFSSSKSACPLLYSYYAGKNANLITNTAASMYINQCTSRPLPDRSLITT
jgi:hypothetical protein